MSQAKLTASLAPSVHLISNTARPCHVHRLWTWCLSHDKASWAYLICMSLTEVPWGLSSLPTLLRCKENKQLRCIRWPLYITYVQLQRRKVGEWCNSFPLTYVSITLHMCMDVQGGGKRSTRYACKDDASHFIKSYWLALAKRQGRANGTL